MFTNAVDAAPRARFRASLARLVALLALAALCAAALTTSSAGAAEVVLKKGDRGPAVAKVQRKLGVTADGVFGPGTLKAVKRFQRRRGLTADGIVGPATRRAMGLARFSRSSVRRRHRSTGGTGMGKSRGSVPRILARIAKCESGGNPRAVSRDGRYRGKYQFMRSTWKALGGRGDPADAPEWLQDRLALRLYRKSGTAPWPSCG